MQLFANAEVAEVVKSDVLSWPTIAPESFIPQGWPFAFYGIFYAAGWQLFGREQFLDAWRPYVWHVVASCILMFVRCSPYKASAMDSRSSACSS